MCLSLEAAIELNVNTHKYDLCVYCCCYVCVYVQYDVWAVMVKIIRQVKKDKDGCALRCGT